MEDQSTELYLSAVQRLEINTDMFTPFKTTDNYKRSYCSFKTHTPLAQTQAQTTQCVCCVCREGESERALFVLTKRTVLCASCCKNLIFHWKFVVVHCMLRHLINFSTHCLAALLTAARVYVLFLSSSN